jgi:hypothetical protein
MFYFIGIGRWGVGPFGFLELFYIYTLPNTHECVVVGNSGSIKVLHCISKNVAKKRRGSERDVIIQVCIHIL